MPSLEENLEAGNEKDRHLEAFGDSDFWLLGFFEVWRVFERARASRAPGAGAVAVLF